MGTNYYLLKNVCPTCGRPEERLHIGKSSVGWAFGLHVIPEEGIKTLDDWLPLMDAGVIEDEYGTRIDKAAMLSYITNRSHPRGLSRHEIDKRFCVGHGDGTWDYLVGEFF